MLHGAGMPHGADRSHGAAAPSDGALPLRRLLLVVIMGGFVVHALQFWTQINDDAFITFRYAKFLALGRGPYFNVGEHVEGYTNFLLVPLMAVVWLVGGDGAVLPAAKVLGIAAGAVAAWASAFLCRELLGAILPGLAPTNSADERTFVAVTRHCVAGARTCVTDRLGWVADGLSCVAAALVAINSAVAINSTTGLETTLFGAFITLGLAAMSRGATTDRWRGAGVFFALGAMTRPEGAAVFVVALGLHALTAAGLKTRFLRRDVLIVVGTCAAQLVFRLWAYDGDILPNTYYAKAGGMTEHSSGGYLLGYAHSHLGAENAPTALLRLVAALAAPILMHLASRCHTWRVTADGDGSRIGGAARSWRLALPATGVCAFAVAAVFATGPDWMPGYRQLVPYVPEWSALMVTSLVALVRLFTRRVAACAGSLSLLLLGYVYVIQYPKFVRDRDRCTLRAEGYRGGHEALAQWLGAHADRGDRVALMDIGLIGFLNPDLRILDITGLTDRFIGHSPGPFLAKDFDPAYVYEAAPKFMVFVLHAAYEDDGTEDWRKLVPFTAIEIRLIEHREFKAWYYRPREVPAWADDLERLACLTGAARVFRHEYPERAYYLMVYRRDDGG